MSGCLPPLPQYVSMVWKGTALSFNSSLNVSKLYKGQEKILWSPVCIPTYENKVQWGMLEQP